LLANLIILVHIQNLDYELLPVVFHLVVMFHYGINTLVPNGPDL
jgi:hypothetical protein